MQRHNDAYGHCPRCEHVGWHKAKGKAIIFGDNKRKYKVSLFKCPKCGKKFGFELDGDIPRPKVKAHTRYYNSNKNYSSYYKPLKEEKKDENDFRITQDEVTEIMDRLEKIIDRIDYCNMDVDTAGIILHNVTGISSIFDDITKR